MQSRHDTREAKKPRKESAELSSRAIQYVNDNRGRVLTLEERLDILSLHANLRRDEATVPRKEPVTNKISRLLVRSNKTVGKVWSDFITHGAVLVSNAPANRSERMTRIPKSLEMQSAVRSFIRLRCETRTRTTAKDVMRFLAEQGYLSVIVTDPIQVKAALRQVQRFVKDAGYSRGEHKGAALKLSPQNDLRRAEYVQRMTGGGHAGQRIVYMDESYIHQHYARHNDSLFDPSDESSVKSKHKGRRLCFIATIIGKDQRLQDEGCALDPHQQAGSIETVDIFEGGKQTKDYHVPEGQKHLKLLDRDGQHQIPQDYPCINTQERQQEGGASQSVSAIWNRRTIERSQADRVGAPFRAHKKSVIPVVMEMARSEGRDVVYTSPHHSDLQPIEIVWAIVKGAVGRQYTTSTNFADIRTRLDEAFRYVQSSTAQGCIDAANKQLLELKNHLDTMDAQNESSDDDDERNSDSDSD